MVQIACFEQIPFYLPQCFRNQNCTVYSSIWLYQLEKCNPLYRSTQRFTTSHDKFEIEHSSKDHESVCVQNA